MLSSVSIIRTALQFKIMVCWSQLMCFQIFKSRLWYLTSKYIPHEANVFSTLLHVFSICHSSWLQTDTGSSRFKCKSSFSTESLRIMQEKLENQSWKTEKIKEGFKSQLKSKQNFRTIWIRTSFPLLPNTCISDFTVDRASTG